MKTFFSLLKPFDIFVHFSGRIMRKMTIYSLLFLYLPLIISCEKNVAKKFKGNYLFTTITWTYCGNDVQYDTITYQVTILD